MTSTGAQHWSAVARGAALGGLAGFAARDLDLPGLLSFWGDPTPLVVLGAVAGAALWTTPLRRAAAAAVVALAAAWCLTAFTPLSRWLVEGLPRRDAPGSADAVYVFASDIQQDGDPTAAALARLVHALELVGEQRAQRLVLSELRPPKPSYAAVARPLMDHLGIHAELLAVGPVVNSHDEAVAVAALCRQRGWSRLLAVTSPLHSRRACAALERAGLEVLSSPAPETRYDLESLDRADARLAAFGPALHERLGLLVYAQRGWIAPR